jgi:2,3-bisphosphoglycerate-independent phosphoglycerate mutase
MDGWGCAPAGPGNAIALAQTPNMDRYYRRFPNTVLNASGEEVGLPPGQMGNSEVGHLNLGAGRIVHQDYSRINMAIDRGSFFTNPVLNQALIQAQGHSLHLMGLVSDGGIHSHSNHVYALLELAKKHELKHVFVHAFLDGRDVAPTSASVYLSALEKKMAKLNLGTIATVSGRYFAMDRDCRWDRTALAYRALVYGEGNKAASAVEAVTLAYQRGETDEFVRPTVLQTEEGRPQAQIKDGDVIIFFNFRPDRARQLTRSFVNDGFNQFNRGEMAPTVHFVCFTEYDHTISAPVAFAPERLTDTLSEFVARRKLKQLRIAETEKYAHVTFFFNGGVEEPYPGELRRLIPSPRVNTYDLKPEMSALAVTEAVVEELQRNLFQLVVLNYANVDMVGHTGSIDATVKAVETVDRCVGQVVDQVLRQKGVALITADHGNGEEMLDERGQAHTAHSCNPVPFIVAAADTSKWKVRSGRLADVAPTILALLALPQPAAMTGKSLLEMTK